MIIMFPQIIELLIITAIYLRIELRWFLVDTNKSTDYVRTMSTTTKGNKQ
jgi:hypothetical protein